VNKHLFGGKDIGNGAESIGNGVIKQEPTVVKIGAQPASGKTGNCAMMRTENKMVTPMVIALARLSRQVV